MFLQRVSTVKNKVVTSSQRYLGSSPCHLIRDDYSFKTTFNELRDSSNVVVMCMRHKHHIYFIRFKSEEPIFSFSASP